MFKQDYLPPPLAKSIFDIIGSLLIIVAVSPVLLFLAPFLLLERVFLPKSRGPLLYCEERISAGKRFKFCKIRTCYQEAIDRLREAEGFIHTVELEKERANFTPLGWLIKQIYLDELPQLGNVLKGEMSLVGPRPANLLNYEELLKRGIYNKKEIKAGLTGYFQSYKGKYQKSDAEMDKEYIEFCRARSPAAILWFDLKIIGRTILRVLEHKGL
ncbi:MAG: sugar transferase [Candidatus Magasanikbacteria bacterium]|nr:sugar transferase [Candidatus Magasanikbacteria bacterium]